MDFIYNKKTYPREHIAQLCQELDSVNKILHALNLCLSSSPHRKMRAYLESEGLQVQPFFKPNYVPDSKVFVQDSEYVNNRMNVKQRYLNMGYPNICVECGQGPEWNGMPLVLQLDHINGVSNDHRLENLRILCPNCHTQTDTYAGKRQATRGPRYRQENTD